MQSVSLLKFISLFWFFISPLYFIADYSLKVSITYYLFSLACCLSLFFPSKLNFKNIARSQKILAYIVYAILPFILIALFNTDFDDLKISRDYERDRITTFLANIPLLLLFFTLIYYKAYGKGKILILIVFIVAEYVAYLEGRRTAALLPFILVFFYFAENMRLRWIVFFLPVIFISILALFSFITIRRTGVEAELSLLLQLVALRLFNPGLMGLDIFTFNGEHLHINSITFIWEKTLHNFGLLNRYDGVGNQFGTHYGYLHSSNTVVGINPGVIVEAYLNLGYLGFVITNIMFIAAKVLIKFADSTLQGTGLIVALLIGHGLQMELGYTIALIIRLFILFLLTNIVIRNLPSKNANFPI
jgi:hypothetical protein